MNTFAHRRLDLLLGIILFTVAMTVYLLTLCPTIYWGDCGEMASAAYTLGITHPTGYPVWTMVAKLWTLIFPFGTIIWRLNVLSAIFGSLAVVALYGVGRELKIPRPIAFCFAAMFGFTHTFWQQCLFCETYSLTAGYTCTILYVALHWRDNGCTDRNLRLLAVVFGLSMTNSQINTLFLPGVVAFVLWSRPELLRLRIGATRAAWLKTLSFGALPLLSYLYLPIRAHVHPVVNWGDPETLYGFYYHVTGQAYGQSMFHASAIKVWMNLLHWGFMLSNEYPWAMYALSALGAFAIWSRRESRPAALLLTWVLVANVGYAINYSIYNQYIYYIASYIVLSAFAAYGVAAIWPRLEACIESPKLPALRILGTVGLLLLVAMQIGGHWRLNDLHGNWTCVDYGRNLLASMPQKALLIDNGGDECHTSIEYLRSVGGLRPDITILDRGMMWALYDKRVHRWANIWIWKQFLETDPEARSLYPHGQMTARQSVSEDVLRRVIAQTVAEGRPVCVIRAPRMPMFYDEHGKTLPLSDYLNEHYATADVGLVTRVYPRGKRPSNAQLLAETHKVWSKYSLRGIYDGIYVEDGYLTPIALDYADAGMARAQLAESQGDYADAATQYGNVLKLFRSDAATAGLARCAQRLAEQTPANAAAPKKPA